MLSLLHAVSRDLRAREIPHALVGAGAMAVYGVVRATGDLDLFVTARSVLLPGALAALEEDGVEVECRLGDDADPLAGVVRLSKERSVSVDIVVGRSAWQANILSRATPRKVGAVAVPVVTRADLILLKLFAGASQDLHDAEDLLEVRNRRAVEAAVGREILRLPREARERWRGVERAHGRGR